jgi:hypothetical protein
MGLGVQVAPWSVERKMAFQSWFEGWTPEPVE